MTLSELTAAIEMLRARGVKSYVDVAGGGFNVEFFPPEPPPGPVQRDTSGAAEGMAKKCRCGHWDYEHVNGLCAAQGGGCDPVKCAGEDAKP